MVPRELFDTLRTAFESYTIQFKSAPYLENPNVEKTILHTRRVVENILVLADSLELSENEKAIAEMTAYFHDIGRLWILLPQNADHKVADHAEASVEFLKANEGIYQLDEQTQHIIIQVIINHNKPLLPQKENEMILFYIKLLRDADKLDSWRATSEYITRKGGVPTMATHLAVVTKPFVTPLFCQTIIEGGIPNKNDIQTFNDLVIFQMSWVFDLHFKKSFQLLNQKQYMRHLYDSLPKNDSVIEIYRMIRIYIENRI